MSEVGNFLPVEALQYPQTYSSATTSQRLPAEALQFPQTYSATVNQRIPTEALQFPQTYSSATAANQRLKRTYGIKRDRNRRPDQVG